MFYKVLFFSLCLSLSILNASFLKDFKSFAADFEQTITNASGKVIVYKGSLLIKEPSYILWRYKEPIIKNVYVTDNFAIVDEPELEQAIMSELQEEINIITLLKNAKKSSKDYYISNMYDVEYKLFHKDGTIDKIEYEDALENSVKIKFFRQAKNINIDDETFRFIAPEYYDVIRK